MDSSQEESIIEAPQAIPLKGTAPDISIVIVNYNTRELLRDCLESIYRYPSKYTFETIMVDNHSDDGSYLMVKDEFKDAKAVFMEKNLGYVKANNHAIRDATGRFILLLNPDTRLQPGSLDELVDFMIEHPDAGAVGCKQLDERMRLQLTWGKFPSLSREVIRKAIHYRLALENSSVREYLENKYQVASGVDWVSGSCLLVRREVCGQVGLMDDNFFMYFEDIDWCYRIKKSGWKIYYTPRTHIIHHGGASANLHKIDALVEYRRSQFYFTKKWYGSPELMALKFLMQIKSLFNIGRWSTRYLMEKDNPKKRHEALCMLLIFKRTLLLTFRKVQSPEERVSNR